MRKNKLTMIQRKKTLNQKMADEKTTPVSSRIKIESKARLEAAAQRNRRSESSIIEEAIERFLPTIEDPVKYHALIVSESKPTPTARSGKRRIDKGQEN